MEELQDHPLVEKIRAVTVKGAPAHLVTFNKPIDTEQSFERIVHQEQMTVIEQGKMFALIASDADCQAYVGTVSVPGAFHVIAPNKDVARDMIYDKARKHLGIDIEVDWLQEE